MNNWRKEGTNIYIINASIHMYVPLAFISAYIPHHKCKIMCCIWLYHSFTIGDWNSKCYIIIYYFDTVPSDWNSESYFMDYYEFNIVTWELNARIVKQTLARQWEGRQAYVDTNCQQHVVVAMIWCSKQRATTGQVTVSSRSVWSYIMKTRPEDS